MVEDDITEVLVSENDDVFCNENAIITEQSTTMVVAAASTATSEISYRQHLIAVSKLTYPIILSELLQNAMPVVDIGVVGQLGKQELAAAALATVWFNLWNATMLGFMTAIDTLLAQSYGAKQLDSFAIFTGNSLIVVFLMTMIVSGIVALCGPAMRLFGQDPDLADAAGEFAFRLIPGMFPYYLFKVLTKYLQTQNRLAPGVWIGVMANIMNAIFNWGLVFTAGWGITGAPWATTLTRFIECLLIVLYMYSNKRSLKDTWPVWPAISKEGLMGWGGWKLAVSGALSFSAEAWSFEVTTIMAGLLGAVALDAHIITSTISTFIFLSFPFAIGIAASIRVGQLIGDQKLKDAQRSSHTSFFLSTSSQAILIVILWPCKDILGKLMSSDQDVANLVSQLIPIWCIYMMGDAVQATTGGVLRGLGRQKLVLFLNILAFWVLAVPVGAILTFGVGLGIVGLWWGMVIGIYLSSMIGMWYFCRVDWDNEAKKTLKRLSCIASAIECTDLTISPHGEDEAYIQSRLLFNNED